jgi:hypothetical protein
MNDVYEFFLFFGVYAVGTWSRKEITGDMGL